MATAPSLTTSVPLCTVLSTRVTVFERGERSSWMSFHLKDWFLSLSLLNSKSRSRRVLMSPLSHSPVLSLIQSQSLGFGSGGSHDWRVTCGLFSTGSTGRLTHAARKSVANRPNRHIGPQE